jgi:hypothetical protein
MGAGASAFAAMGARAAAEGGDPPAMPRSLLESISMQDGIDYSQVDPLTLSSRVFAELDTQRIGLLHVEDLVQLATEHFATLETRQPQQWIRAQIERHDEDRNFGLDQIEFARAIDCLRRC